ncbi:hypothetical protein ACFU7Y_35845, partial [Kitasatospora sp. NPDC057542]
MADGTKAVVDTSATDAATDEAALAAAIDELAGSEDAAGSALADAPADTPADARVGAPADAAPGRSAADEVMEVVQNQRVSLDATQVNP